MRIIRCLSLLAFIVLMLAFTASFFVGVEVAGGRLSLVAGNTGFSLWLTPKSESFYCSLPPAAHLPWMYYFSPPTINWLGAWQLQSSWLFLIAVSMIAASLSHIGLRRKARKAGAFPVEILHN